MRSVLYLLTLLFLISACEQAVPEDDNLKFSFGKKAEGSTAVLQAQAYSDSLGYGFDYLNTAAISEQGFCTSNSSIYFSVKLPEGDYKINITFGDENGKSRTSVKAENRRLMLEKIITAQGEIRSEEFIVNVRTPRINDSTSIRLKSREHKYLNWDNKLTLEFCDSMPKVRSLEITPVKPAKTIYLAGNSTVTDQSAEPWASWGQMLPAFVKSDVSVANYAESGESLNSFYHARRLLKILSVIQPGDYLFIEMAHNDQKRRGEGIGPWQSYSDYLRTFVDSARNKQAIPVLITSMHRRRFDENGKQIHTLGDYPDAMRAIAKEKKVILIELNNMSEVMYETWGAEDSKKAFVQYPAGTYPGQTEDWEDNTHHNNYGAYNIALCIMYGIRHSEYEDLKSLLNDRIPAFAPDQPIPLKTWEFPASNLATNEVPEGS